MIIVTGGAGFIGSCIVRTLNDAGIEDIVIVDDIASTDKWMNLRNKRYIKYVHKSRFLDELPSYKNVTAIIHMGACSSTTERDFDYLWNNNFEFTKALWSYCSEKQISFIYASSAATYGDGSQGFDDTVDIDLLRPLNGYGYSKQLFDLWVKHQARVYPAQHVGLKFFNVYGPNEYFKGSMASMVYHGFNQIKNCSPEFKNICKHSNDNGLCGFGGGVRLFKSYRHGYKDGEQLRDFVYVKDVCKVIHWLLINPTISGLFNVGTGQARTFNALVEAIFTALEITPKIEYVEMPEHLKNKYQYYTQSEMGKLRNAGYDERFTSLEYGVRDYVVNYLNKDFMTY